MVWLASPCSELRDMLRLSLVTQNDVPNAVLQAQLTALTFGSFIRIFLTLFNFSAQLAKLTV